MIKPEFFDDPTLSELSPIARLFFIGLWTQADREGRLIDNPRRIKARLFPFDDIDVDGLLIELSTIDVIRRYRCADNKNYIWIRSFVKHQRPHPKEPASVIPKWSDAAAKKHGETRKNTASNQSNGFLSLDSGTRNLGSHRSTNGASRKSKAVPSAQNPKFEKREEAKNVRVITKIAHEVMNANGHRTDADTVEAIKALCAQRHIAYDSETVRKALDSAEAQTA